jgi:hypothetical protein
MRRHARLYVGLPNRDDACEAGPWLRGLGTQELGQRVHHRTATTNTRGSERLRGRASHFMPIRNFVPAWLRLSGSVESPTRAAEHKSATGFRGVSLSRGHTRVTVLPNGHKTVKCTVPNQASRWLLRRKCHLCVGSDWMRADHHSEVSSSTYFSDPGANLPHNTWMY